MSDTKRCDQCDQQKPSNEIHLEWVDPVGGANGPVPVTVCKACDKWGRSMGNTEREYTPTTDAVRGAATYEFARSRGIPLDLATEQVDRWLAAHDAQIRADERERMRDWLERHAEELVQEASERIARSGGAS